MGATDTRSYDLPRLQAELEQEREVKEMLMDSVSDLTKTLADLQERLNSVDGEGNEWRTRYEAQIDLKVQLKRQIGLVQDRLEGLRGNPMDRLASIRSYEEMTVENLRQQLKLLTAERCSLHSQLMECRMRIQQEGKAYQKANDERRAYRTEIAKMSSGVALSRKQHLAQKDIQRSGKQATGMAKHVIEDKKGAGSQDKQIRLPQLKCRQNMY